MLERDAGNAQLARELLKCAVKADPKSEPSWLVSGPGGRSTGVEPWGEALGWSFGGSPGKRSAAACAPALPAAISRVAAMPVFLPIPPQTWAQMEEDLGFYQRAAELRSFSMQARGRGREERHAGPPRRACRLPP